MSNIYKNITKKVIFVKVGGNFISVQPNTTIKLLQGNVELTNNGLVRNNKEELENDESQSLDFTPLTEEELEKMTKDELNDLGVTLNIDVKASWNKNKIIEKLLAGKE